MDTQVARQFLESLLQRLAPDANGKPHIPGPVSQHELTALKMAVEVLGGAPAPEPFAKSAANVEVRLPAAEEQAKPAPRRPVELNLESLRSTKPDDPEVLLCLDFGTAMSKAFASSTAELETTTPLRLHLGDRVRHAGHAFAVPSSLWIGDDARIYLGPKAVALSLQSPDGKRQRFDSLKNELTQGELASSPDQVRLSSDINPTGVPLSQGDAITLYLAFLTDLACSELTTAHKRSRYVRRRFALPSWSAERRKWGEQMLSDMLARAQVVADTFSGRWEFGIEVEEAKGVLEAVRKLERRPSHLVGEGVSEPLAAGASRLRRDEEARGLAMVVDVGAGTTDFALFLVAEAPDRDIFKAWPIKGCSEALHMAGNTLDYALRKVILESARVSVDDPDFRYVNTALSIRIRGLKEDLFRSGSCSFTLNNGARGSVSRDEFLSRPEVRTFEKRLSETFVGVLARADKSFADRLRAGGLTVVLTGGGASLPMVTALGAGSVSAGGIILQRHKAPLVPSAFSEHRDLSEAYPQLAVAIGGAMPELIGEGDGLEKMAGLGPVRWSVGRFQVTGT